MNLEECLHNKYSKSIKDCTDREIYLALLEEVQRLSEQKRIPDSSAKKKLYYFSAEFLIGKLLSNNMINLGIYSDVKRQLEKNGRSIAAIEECEPEPSLGNGGLGRLAACFLDSIATLGLNGDGIGLNYHCGLFRQKFKEHKQSEQPDKWIESESWLIRTNRKTKVDFKGFSVSASMYDINITGYCGRTNRLHLFDIESVNEEIIEDGISFDKTDIEKNLTLFLYPDDSDEEGRLLRIYQQYFMVCCGAELILDECMKKGCRLYDLPDYAVIQINDTHPTMIIPELIRRLCEMGIDMDDAIEIVSRTCAYTNHTILAEALEKWDIESLKKTVPRLVPVIEVLDDRIRRKYSDEKVYIIDGDDRVHMANIDIHCSFKVNGVAELHTDILKETELNRFYKLYPEKFTNKTNGITFRRWLMYANPQLSDLITSLIGDSWKKEAEELRKLEKFRNDENVLKRLLEIKYSCKKELCGFLKKTQDSVISPDTIFDIQIKRLHEYKRQQMNALYVIRKYLEIKSGKKPEIPITVIFGAKAAPAYVTAKDIIHLILCLQELINSDSEVNKYLRIVMVENYNVTKAEKLIPACDISEQISLASKEASGTGNMKFMLNGAVTLGTEDGANVEIHRLVGDDNIYIFGDNSDTVVKRYAEGSYNPREYCEKNPAIKKAVDFITGSEMLEIGDKKSLERLKNELLKKDWFMTFPDFEDYCKTRERAYSDYRDRMSWAKKMLVNISRAGYFSSDRTISEYQKEIWRL
ncbi:MAG: glycogen/starch/alpha-glucan phosphorylase [Ruminococcus sp.]